jgi:hypothetical protein
MTIAAFNRSLEGLEFLATVIEHAIEVAFLLGVLIAVGALTVWMDRWAGPRKTFIGFTRASSGRAAEAAKRREFSRPPSPATEPRHTGDRARGAEDAGELVGKSSFPASDPPAVWTWEPPGPFPSG